MRRGPALLPILLLLAGCVAPASNEVAVAPAKTATVAGIEALLKADRPDEALALIGKELGRARKPETRAELRWLEGRALSANGRHRSAALAFGRALDEAPSRHGELAWRIYRDWAAAEMASGRYSSAAKRFGDALDLELGTVRDQDDLAMSAYIAARAARDDAAAATWRKRIRRPNDLRLAMLERKLLPPSAVPSAAAVPVATSAALPGGIPADPRDLLPEIHVRSEWGAAPIKGKYDAMTPIARLTVHHTALPTLALTPARAAVEIRGIQSSHQEKWADLGYHFMIDPMGGIWEGRALRWQGAHEGAGLNQGAIGICLLGDFDKGPVPAPQLASLKRLLDSCRARFGLSTSAVRTHKEVRPDPTECPGAALQTWVNTYRASAGSLARQ